MVVLHNTLEISVIVSDTSAGCFQETVTSEVPEVSENICIKI